MSVNFDSEYSKICTQLQTAIDTTKKRIQEKKSPDEKLLNIINSAKNTSNGLQEFPKKLDAIFQKKTPDLVQGFYDFKDSIIFCADYLNELNKELKKTSELNSINQKLSTFVNFFKNLYASFLKISQKDGDSKTKEDSYKKVYVKLFPDG